MENVPYFGREGPGRYLVPPRRYAPNLRGVVRSRGKESPGLLAGAGAA